LRAEDLSWWADDHRLVSKSLTLASRGNFRPLATIGSKSGLEHAPAVEIPIGSGGILCAQWLLTQRFDVEPLAGVLLQRLLNYCAPAPGHLAPRPAALLAETNSPAALKLSQLGLQAENFSGKLTKCDPNLYPVLVIAGGDAAWQEAALGLSSLTDFVNHGGTLILHRPSAPFLTSAQSSLFPELDPLEADASPVLRRDAPGAVVQVDNHNLYWIEQAGDWNRPELLSTNIAHRYYRKRFNLTAYSTIQVENMPIKTAGGSGPGGW